MKNNEQITNSQMLGEYFGVSAENLFKLAIKTGMETAFIGTESDEEKKNHEDFLKKRFKRNLVNFYEKPGIQQAEKLLRETDLTPFFELSNNESSKARYKLKTEVSANT